MNQYIFNSVVIIAALIQVIVGQGDNHFALKLDGTGYANLPTGINEYLDGSFTIELWFSSEAISVFQPLLSHGLKNEWNAYIDLNLQVTTKGTLSFFMGNGESSAYGFKMDGPAITRNQWYHVAVAVEKDVVEHKPKRARMYLNGQIVGEQPWKGGNRQLISTPVSIGLFDNSDPGVQTFYGLVDEVRIWNSFRTPAQIAYTYKHKVTAEESVNLVAYYRFEEPNTDSLFDETETFPAVPYNAKWDAAGVSFPAYYTVDSSQRAFYVVDLPYLDTNQELNFTIVSLPSPTGATIYAVDDNDKVQQKILNVPFELSNNKIAFLWDFYVQNEVFTFQYQVGEESTADVIFNVLQELTCDGLQGTVVDSCGVCGGDETYCQCIWGVGQYKGFGLSELDKIMAFYSVETTLQLLQEMRENLEVVYRHLDSCKNDSDLNLSLVPALSVLNNFYSKALEPVEEVQDIVASV